MTASSRKSFVAWAVLASALCLVFSTLGAGVKRPQGGTSRAKASLCAPAPESDFKLNVKDPRFGAIGDGVANDTTPIQMAINAASGSGGTVVIPSGTYLVDPIANASAGIRLRSNLTLRLDPGAILRALPTSTSNHAVLLLSGVRNVTIRGGTIIGNRYNNTIRDTGQGGIGIKITESRQVVLEGITSKDSWDDGFYIGESSKDVLLCAVVADGNRRQGLAITSVDGLVIKGSTFNNTTGFLDKDTFVCGSGIDIEPNVGQAVSNVEILGCSFFRNATEGIAIGPSVANRGRAYVKNVLVDGNLVVGNGVKNGPSGITISNTSGHRVTHNMVKGNSGIGICLRNEANENLVTDNTVTGTRAAAVPGENGIGILLYQTAGNQVRGNTLTNNAGCGVRDSAPSGLNALGLNTLKGNHPDICR